jgi:hypothetical protein
MALMMAVHFGWFMYEAIFKELYLVLPTVLMAVATAVRTLTLEIDSIPI